MLTWALVYFFSLLLANAEGGSQVGFPLSLFLFTIFGDIVIVGIICFTICSIFKLRALANKPAPLINT